MKLIALQGDKSTLSDIDQFLLKLMRIPNLKSKLDLLLTVYEFPLQVGRPGPVSCCHTRIQFEELQPEINIVLKACQELVDSKRLEEVMHYVLSIGNYVNGGTPKGGCHGFMLKSLPKLADARGLLDKGILGSSHVAQERTKTRRC
jgi:hypothetical protein